MCRKCVLWINPRNIHPSPKIVKKLFTRPCHASRKKLSIFLAFNIYHFFLPPDFDCWRYHWSLLSLASSRVNNESIIVNWKKVKRVRRFFLSLSPLFANWFNFWSLVIWFFFSIFFRFFVLSHSTVFAVDFSNFDDLINYSAREKNHLNSILHCACDGKVE